MGRELKRKQAKKEGKNIHEEVIVENNNISLIKVLKVLGVLITILVLLYVVVGLFLTKELNWFNNTSTTNNTTTDEVDNAILAKSIFRQSEGEYYVYFYNFNKEISNIESAIIGKLYDYTVYRVNTEDTLNKNYISETSNPSATSLDDLKVKSPTLIKIKDGKITEYYETEENILSYLGY